jgi:clusterin-associated protein 1
MDEYEKLEKELQRQYEVYLGRFRNLDYLQHELDLYHQVRLVHAWICSRALGI